MDSLEQPKQKIRMIKSRKVRRTGHVARMGEKTNPYRVVIGTPEGKRPLRRPRVDVKILLKWILYR
jgi:hypothetical protein